LLVCETIDVGPSDKKTKDIQLPRAGMHCSNTPRNPQRPDWTDQYKASIEGQMLTVTREDGEDWSQMLQLKCCDDEASAANKEKVKIKVPSVVMFMPHDERHAIYEGDFEDMHALDRWISARRTPMVMRLTQDTAEKILDAGPEKSPVLFLISSQERKDLQDVLRSAAAELRGRMLVCISGMQDLIEKRLADMAGVDDESPPVITLIETRAGGGPFHTARKYRLETEGLSKASVASFIEKYEQGKLTPWLKSEPEPSKEDVIANGPVGVLVGTSFTARAHDSSVDVLVDFYAPWCGHCRKFEPAYKKLAAKLKHVRSLKIMKIDATRNEIENMQIMGFPTIILFPAGQAPKQQITYHGNRQHEDMVRWLHEHCAIRFDDRPPPEVKDDSKESGLLDDSEEDL